MQGPYNQSYQPLGDLHLAWDHAAPPTDYCRELDLRTAIAGVRYRCGAVTYQRELFISAPAQVLVVRLTADQSGALNVTATLTTPHLHQIVVHANEVTLTGKAPAHVAPSSLSYDDVPDPIVYAADGGGMTFVVQLAVCAEGGQVTSQV